MHRGRPVKKIPPGQKRVQVSMILSTRIKTLIDEVAKRNGRTFSQTSEMLLERCLAVDHILEALQTSLIIKDWRDAMLFEHESGTGSGKTARPKVAKPLKSLHNLAKK